MTGVELTEAEELIIWRAYSDWRDYDRTHGVMHHLPPAVAQIVAARLAPVEAERDEARGERPSGFWSQRRWEDWSNDLATLIPEDLQAGNPEGAQESIIEDTVRHLVTEVARLTAEVKHWKDHAEEAGRGFAQVCRDFARVSARNVELVALVEAGLELADGWIAYDAACREGDGVNASGPHRPKMLWLVAGQRIRAVLGGAK